MFVQKKISFEEQQSKIIEHYKEYGFRDQSDMVRCALKNMIRELEKEKRALRLQREAEEAAHLYQRGAELTFLMDIEGEDFE